MRIIFWRMEQKSAHWDRKTTEPRRQFIFTAYQITSKPQSGTVYNLVANAYNQYILHINNDDHALKNI
jgi:hypothetical protein